MTEEHTRPAAPGRLATGAFVALGLLVLALAGWRTIATADIWTHIACGRDIVHNGIPRAATLTFALPPDTGWVNATWLYDLGAAALWKFGGSPLVTVGHIAAILLAFALLALTALRRGDGEGWPVALALGVTTLLFLPVFSPSPLLVAPVFVAAFLARLWRGSCWRIARFALPALQVVWTNMHPSFVLGPMLAALFAIDARLIERRGGKPEIPATALTILAAALALLTLANPYGFGLHAWILHNLPMALRDLSLDAASYFAVEFAQSSLRYAPYAAVAVAAAGMVLIRDRLSIGFTGAAALGAFLLFRSPALTPVSAALLFPFVAASLASFAPGRTFRRLAGGITLVALAVLAAFLAGGRHLDRLGLAARMGLGIQTDVFPADAAQIIASGPAFPARMLNFPPEGGFLAVRMPRRDIFCDTRIDLYGDAFLARLARGVLGDAQELRTMETEYGCGAILVNCSWPQAGNAAAGLTARGRWALAYFDGAAAIFLRNTVENVPSLRDRRLQRSGIEKIEAARRDYAARVEGGSAPGVSPRLIGAGHIYLGLGRFQEARVVYALLTRGSPHMHGAWLGLGIAQEQLGEHAEAIAALQRAAAMRPKDPLPLLWLSRAWRASGKTQEADAAVEKARALNATLTEAFLKSPPGRPQRR